MKAEYFPPKEDVILQNEAPTDLYILVTGAVDFRAFVDGTEHVQGKAEAGEVFGEVGVLCYRPQPFTVRTTKLSQILRLSSTTLMNAIRENAENGAIVMNNLFQKSKLNESLYSRVQHKDSEVSLKERYQPQKHSIPESVDIGSLLCTAAESSDLDAINKLLTSGLDVNSTDADGRTALHAAVLKGDFEMIKLLLKYGASTEQPDANGRTPRGMAKKQGKKEIYRLLLDHESRVKFIDNHQTECNIDIIAKNNRYNEMRNNTEQSMLLRYSELSEEMKCSDSGRRLVDNRRVTIHLCSQKSKQLREQMGKLINLPSSLEELLRIGGQKFVGHNPIKVVNRENAEIDDISVVRDGDHLFLLEM